MRGRSRVGMTAGPGLAAALAVAGVGCGPSESTVAANALRERLRAGMTVAQVVETAHEVRTAHPDAWVHASVWGTPTPLAHDAVHDAARMKDSIEGVTWGAPSPAERGEAAERLKGARQLWFTMRGAGLTSGYLHLTVELDASGRVTAVAEVSGHAA